MALSSVSSSQIKKYDVYLSSYGTHVENTFIRHLHKKLSYKGITTFYDQSRERSEAISPDLVEAIRESKIAIVVFSKNYASSKGCLYELLEILRRNKLFDLGVMPVYYGVNPTDVRRQTGEFGEVFKRTSIGKENQSLHWREALIEVSNLVGWDINNWKNEAAMIEAIARNISTKLHTANSKDFEHIVGLRRHLEKMKTWLQLDNEEARIVGIYGPAGTGKTTIAKALYSQLSCSFHSRCFMENIRGSYKDSLDEYGFKLWLQEQLLSKIFNINDIKAVFPDWKEYHLEEMVCNKKVLIILDDVDDPKQLEALVNEFKWFPGSRIIAITQDQKILTQLGFKYLFSMESPSSEEALEIFCGYAFGQSYPPDGFEELAKLIVDLCHNLPSSLCKAGLSLRGKKEEEWAYVIRSLEPRNDPRDIERVVREAFKSSSSKTKSRCFNGMAFLVLINLVTEIASVVSDQLSSNRKPYFTRISLAMSILSVVFSILDLSYKIREQRACFRCKWPIPWFYYPSRGYKRIFGSYTDTVLLFCVFGGLIVSTINYRFVATGRDGPIKASIWPLFFAIGMVVSKFLEKPINSSMADPSSHDSMVSPMADPDIVQVIVQG